MNKPGEKFGLTCALMLAEVTVCLQMVHNTASCNTWMSLGSGHQGAVLGEVLSTVPVEEGLSALDIIKPY